MNMLFRYGFLFLCMAGALIHLSSCKSCKKEEPTMVSTADTNGNAAASAGTFSPIQLPHADTALIPILGAVLENAFDASLKKDYNRLGSLIIYRGPDSLKYGYDVFDARKNFDKRLVRITGEVFNKWNKDLESREYLRVFQLGDPNYEVIPVIEVLFVSKKTMSRKFFIFQQLRDEWKIAEVTSNL